MGRNEMTRRQFLRAGGKAGLALIGFEGGVDVLALANAEKIHYPITRVEMNGVSEKSWVVHLSDVHVGGMGMDRVNYDVLSDVRDGVNVRLRKLGAVRERTMFCFVGDGINKGSVGMGLGRFGEVMGAVVGIEAGSRFMVAGNHEMYHEMSNELMEVYRELGFRVLAWGDEVSEVMVGEFRVLGTPDFTTVPEWYEGSEFRGMMGSFGGGEPVLWLTHNASPFDLLGVGEFLRENNNSVLALCGHTHGGQVSGVSLAQVLCRSYALGKIGYESSFISGLYDLGNEVCLAVSNGIGSATTVRTAERQVGIVEILPKIEAS